jgi:hypothetical protein
MILCTNPDYAKPTGVVNAGNAGIAENAEKKGGEN